MLRVLFFVVSLALAVYAASDAIQTPDERVRHLPKIVWVLVILAFPLAGALTWLFVGTDTTISQRLNRAPRPGAPRNRPLGPDDDPDFLKGL